VGDVVALVFFALACGLPCAFAGYRHGYWKGKHEGRQEIMDRFSLGNIPAAMARIVEDPLAGAGGASSPAPLVGVGGVAGRAVPMLTDPGGGTAVSQTPLVRDVPKS